jgi:hypothetical protein
LNEFGTQFLVFFNFFLFVFARVWWILIPLILFLIYYSWLQNKRLKFLDSLEYVFLAITVPIESEKNPSSMEQVFAGLYGIESVPNFVENYFKGEVQPEISLELVGINGHIRFLIRTPEMFRDLVEANVYAQYPDAEITEVEDYTKFAPDKYPNDKYEMFGTEFVLGKKDAYPIRTYHNFADQIAQEFIDPIAVITEVLSRLSEGEQIWLQFILRPAGDNWKKEGEKVIAKLAGKKVEEKVPLAERPIQSGAKIWHGTLKGIETALGVPEAESTGAKEEPPSLVQYMTPGESEVVTAIERNITKVGFEVKFRFVYIAHKEIFNKPKGVSSVVGAINLFNTKDLNTFKSFKKAKTKVDYFKFRIPRRQKKLIRNYKLRRMEQGASPFVLNIEELATVFHFPYTSVKAPTISRPEAKTMEPPSDLPVG